MKKIQIQLILILLFASIAVSKAQYAEDALRFSRLSVYGTARTQSMGGVGIALGGDMSNANINPAGLGMLRKSEFSTSLGIGASSTETDFLGETTPDSKTIGALNHIGIVIAMPNDEKGSKWRGGSFGISVMRTNNFQNQFSYQGTNTQSSKTDFYVDEAWGIPLGQLQNLQDYPEYEYLRAAYFAFLINPYSTQDQPNAYFTGFRNENEDLFEDAIQQSESLNTKGGQYNWNFSYGGNFDDKLYFGFSMGIATLNYKRAQLYRESMDSQESLLESFEEKNDYRVRGTGVNLSMGLQFRPVDFFRIGVTATTPTWYDMREQFQTFFSSRAYDDEGVLGTYNEQTLPGEFRYRLSTPWRLGAGLAVFIQKYGFITAEAEYSAFDSMKLTNAEFTEFFAGENQTIRTTYQPAWTYRIGGEFRYDIFRGRVGAALQTNPYSNVNNFDSKILNITGGLGVRMDKWYADLAVVNTSFDSTYQPYTSELYAAPKAQTRNNFTTGTITVGFHF
jgi:hypothetical protein